MKLKKILIVEDSTAMIEFEKRSLEERFDFPILIAETMQEAIEVIKKNKDDIFVALADLILPDAQDGEIVEYLTTERIPTIVFTGQYNEHLRNFIMSKPIVDYILKTNLNNFEYALRLVSVIHENQFIKALVVDDSEFARLKMELSLRRLQLDVIHANGAEEAFKKLEENSDIKLIVTDYHMDMMASGIYITEEVRRKYGNDSMAIIGYSSDKSRSLPIEFLKKGANDYIPYNYSEEEFTLRILNNLENMNYLKNAREIAIKDYLTGLYNRRYIFEFSKQLFHQVKRGQLKLGVAMIDIDFFKKVNDTYGHNCGDKVIKHISKILENNIRKGDILARLGGEEFCVLVNNADDKSMEKIFENLRLMVADSPLMLDSDCKNNDIETTISIGFTTKKYDTLDEAIKEADTYLYMAKSDGRNCIRF